MLGYVYLVSKKRPSNILSSKIVAIMKDPNRLEKFLAKEKDYNYKTYIFSLDEMEIVDDDVDTDQMYNKKKFYMLRTNSGIVKIYDRILTSDEVDAILHDSEDKTYVWDAYRYTKGAFRKEVETQDEEILPVLLDQQCTTIGELRNKDEQLRNYYNGFGLKYIHNIFKNS